MLDKLQNEIQWLKGTSTKVPFVNLEYSDHGNQVDRVYFPSKPGQYLMGTEAHFFACAVTTYDWNIPVPSDEQMKEFMVQLRDDIGCGKYKREIRAFEKLQNANDMNFIDRSEGRVRERTYTPNT